jgi:hypothetical protein
MMTSNSHVRLQRLIGCIVIASSLIAIRAAGEDRKHNHADQATAITDVFDDMLNAAKSGEWNEPSWSSKHVEQPIKEIIVAYAKASGRESLQLPLNFSSLHAPSTSKRYEDDGLLITSATDVKGAFLKNSVVLATGIVRLDGADHCIVIARGVALVKAAESSIIIGGQHISVGTAGVRNKRTAPSSPPRTTLLLSGGTVIIGIAGDAVCSAGRRLTVAIPGGLISFNTPAVDCDPIRPFPQWSREGIPTALCRFAIARGLADFTSRRRGRPETITHCARG